MCSIFSRQPRDRYASVTRSIRLNGQCTSLRLEAMFWEILEEMAQEEGKSMPQFVATIHDEALDAQGEIQNFTSLLRCACLTWLSLRPAAPIPQTPLPQTRSPAPVKSIGAGVALADARCLSKA